MQIQTLKSLICSFNCIDVKLTKITNFQHHYWLSKTWTSLCLSQRPTTDLVTNLRRQSRKSTNQSTMHLPCRLHSHTRLMTKVGFNYCLLSTMEWQAAVVLLDSLVLYCSLTTDKILKSICTLNILNDFDNSNFKNYVNYVQLFYCLLSVDIALSLLNDLQKMWRPLETPATVFTWMQSRPQARNALH